MSKIPTNITVRVIAKDGKFLGDDIGGAFITVKNAVTGELLTKGYIKGGSGDTKEIMQSKRTWSQPIPTKEASKFAFTLKIEEPCLIEVTAYGPAGGLQSANNVSATQWVIPGKHITKGDGILLVMPGLLIQVLEPATHTNISKVPAKINFSANVTMMCGCPISPGGVWDSKDFQVWVDIIKSGKVIDTVKLMYAGVPSLFNGSWTLKQKGYYEAVFYAFQPSNGNAGMGRVTFFYIPQ